MPHTREKLAVLAEALAPLSHSLAAGLLLRPVAISSEPPDGAGLHTLALELEAVLKGAVPVIRSSMAALESCQPDETEELVDDMAAAALDIVDASRRVWQEPFEQQMEGLRPLLATCAEAPAAYLLQWILEIMQYCIDPWSSTEDPEHPEIDFAFQVPDVPLRDALKAWRRRHPGVLPEDMLSS